MNTDGYAVDSIFEEGLTTDLIQDKSGVSAIELDATTINFDSFNLEHNGVTIPTGSSAVSNPMIANLDAGTFNITNIGVGGVDDLVTVISEVDANTTAISTLETKTQNLDSTALSSVFQGGITLLNNTTPLTYPTWTEAIVTGSVDYGFRFVNTISQTITKVGQPEVGWTSGMDSSDRTFRIWTEGVTGAPLFSVALPRTTIFEGAYVIDVNWALPAGTYRTSLSIVNGQSRNDATITANASLITGVNACRTGFNNPNTYPGNTDGAIANTSYGSQLWFLNAVDSVLTVGDSTITAVANVDSVQFSGNAQVATLNAVKVLSHRIVVQTVADFGTIDSTFEYFIDGIVDCGNTTILVPSTGVFITGYDFNISKLISSENNFSLFTNGASGDIIIRDLAIEITGTSSEVFSITSNTGNEAIEFERVNFNDCTSLGNIDNYRQLLLNGCGWFGGTPDLTLVGAWSGGCRVSTCIIRDLDAGMTGALFKAGVGFVMQSRFLTDLNLDLPASAAFIDFSTTNFPNSNTVQLKNCIVTRNGVVNPNDSNLTPNLLPSTLSSDFVDNLGLPSTLFGGRITLTIEVLTTITTINTYVTLLGTYTPSELVHFDSPSNGQLRHLSSQPRDFLIFGDLHLTGSANDLISIRIIKVFADTTEADLFTQNRVVQAVTGAAPDQVEFNISANVTLDLNDKIYLKVANKSGTDNITLTLSSYIFLVNR